MYTCNHCKKKLKNEPYMCSNNKKYCSFECIPESGIDQPYSFQYFILMDRIRDIGVDIENIKSLEDRIDLEDEIEELSTSYTLEIYGDSEGLFYKRQIGLLLETKKQLAEMNVEVTREIGFSKHFLKNAKVKNKYS
jgi:hypothetical protein